MLPTLEHELIDSRWAVHRSRKPEGLVDSFHDLRKGKGAESRQRSDQQYIYNSTDKDEQPEEVLRLRVYSNS